MQFERQKAALESFNPNHVADTPEELNGYMNTNIKYGFIVNGRLETEDYSEYRTISPRDFEKYHSGVCWDYVAYEVNYFQRQFKNLPCKLFYIEAEAINGSEPTHTRLTYKNEGKVIAFESAWDANAGLHVYNSEAAMLKDYISKFIKFNERLLTNEKHYAVITFNQPKVYDLAPGEYMRYIWKHGKIVQDHGLSELIEKEDN